MNFPPTAPLSPFDNGDGFPFPGFPVPTFDSFGIPLRYSRLGLASSAETLCNPFSLVDWLVQHQTGIFNTTEECVWSCPFKCLMRKILASIVFLTTSKPLATYGFVTTPSMLNFWQWLWENKSRPWFIDRLCN